MVYAILGSAIGSSSMRHNVELGMELWIRLSLLEYILVCVFEYVYIVVYNRVYVFESVYSRIDAVEMERRIYE